MSTAPMEMYPIVGLLDPFELHGVWRQLDNIITHFAQWGQCYNRNKERTNHIYLSHYLTTWKRTTWTKYQTWSTCWCDFDSILLPFLFYNSTPPSTPPLSSMTIKPLLTLLVAMVQTLQRSDWEPSSVTAVVICHVVSPNPQKLMALVHIERRQCWLIPPIPLLTTTATFLSVIICCYRCWTLTCIDFKSFVGGDEGCVAPISLDTATLCSPIVCIPYWAVYAHSLVPWKGNPFVFHIGVQSNWGIIH